MQMAAHAVDLVAREELVQYLEPCHEPSVAGRVILRIPVTGDLRGIFLVEDG